MALFISNDVTARVLKMTDAVDKIAGNHQDQYGDYVIGVQQGCDLRPSGKAYRRRVGPVVYEKARKAGLSMKIPMEWFQQDIRN